MTALQYYAIEVLSDESNLIKVARGYEVEVEINGIYKLFSDGQVVAPFTDALDNAI